MEFKDLPALTFLQRLRAILSTRLAGWDLGVLLVVVSTACPIADLERLFRGTLGGDETVLLTV